jgi:hypothetical protein
MENIQCPRCGKEVIEVPLDTNPEQTIRLDATPDRTGTVAVLNNQAVYLSGAKAHRLIEQYGQPKYVRHNIRSCPNIYPKHPMALREYQ